MEALLISLAVATVSFFTGYQIRGAIVSRRRWRRSF